MKLKRIGWAGFSENKPFFEDTSDDHTECNEAGTPMLSVFKVKKQARKRFDDVREVFVKEKE